MIPILLKTLLLVALAGLMGCDEKPAEEKVPPQTLDKGLYQVSTLPVAKEEAAPIIEEPAIITPVEFPELSPLTREERAKNLRGQRQAAANNLQSKASAEIKRFHLRDEDYQQNENPLPEDKSTLPVDRSRILTTDMRIGAVLEDNLNSQIPGRIIAIVDRDVLSPNGKYILLPAYTKIICSYEGLDKTGETRLMVTCTRILRPDGLSISLTDAISSDQMGRTGLIGEVDNRIFERYGGAFIISSISALAQSGVNQSQAPWLNNAVNSLSNNLGQVTNEVIKQNIDLRPIITIKAGSKIQIIPQTDIVLRKPLEVKNEKIQ